MNKNPLFYVVAALALLIVLLLVFGIVLGMGWPWWVGIFLVILLAGIGLVGVIIRQVMVRKREQQFVSQIIEQDNAYLRSLKDDERKQINDLQERWKEAVEALKKSHLKQQGNPLYVLPWYMVVGESGSGKTTAIKSAKLSSPFAEVNRISGFSGTKNCDWWFFEQAVIIDTAGRYAIPVDEGRDKEEWQKFIALLAKYRTREPLNGLVVSVAADKLLEAKREVLEDDGKNIRRRIDELMRALGSKFPVYLLVTKCDLVQGMTQFCDQLSEAGQQQAMGMINHTGKNNPEGFVRNLMHTVSERLRNIRLLQLHKADPGRLDPALLLFPEEFSKLEEGLITFMKAAFEENPYQESPLLRGIYFSSGRQEGTPYSHFLKNLGLIEERDVLPGTSKGLFLHDFFARILPRERHLFAPTRQAIEWSRLTRSLGLLSWLAIGIAVCGLLSFSFVKNLSIIRSVPNEPPVLKGEFSADVATLENYRKGIIKLEEGNRHWWIPRFGLNESRNIEGRLKDNYCRLVDQGVVAPMNRKIEGDIVSFSASTADSPYAQEVVHMVRRINLISSRIKEEDLQGRPLPACQPFVPASYGASSPEMAKTLANLYLYRLIWSSNPDSLSKESTQLRIWLGGALQKKPGDFRWVAVFVSENASLPGASLKQFWGGSNDLPGEPSVPGAFTLEGKKRVDALFDEICLALGDSQAVNSQKPAFQEWYRQNYLAGWEAFARAFTRGPERLRGKAEWEQAASRMAGRESPYFSFIRRMKAEIAPYEAGKSSPVWVALVNEFGDVADQAAAMGALGAAGGGGILTKVAETGSKIKQTIATAGGSTSEADAAANQVREIKSYAVYTAALNEAAAAVKSSRAAIFQLTSATFAEGTPAASPFVKARDAFVQVKASSATPADPGMWLLVQGPLDFLWAYACQETACHLQELWVKDVLVNVQGVTDPMQLSTILGGPNGPATKFMQGPAAPFVSRDLKGFASKEALGRKIPFNAGFLTFSASSGKPVQPNYAMTITGMPTDANPDAGTKPHATRLELQCGGEPTVLENLNYPVRKVFNYSPQTCLNTMFSISVGNLTLTVPYSGAMGFAKFLSDFKGGSRTFRPDDFPKDSASLRRMGVKYIRVNYRFEGSAEQAAGLFSEGSGSAPERITACWGQ